MTVMLRSVTTWSNVQGLPGYTNLYWRPGTGGGSTADASDIAARVRACWLACVGALVTGMTLQVSGVTEAIEDTTGALTGVFTGTTPAVVTGTGGGSLAPRGSGWTVQANTDLIVGRRFLKGRTFLAPLPTTAFNASGTPLGFGAVATAFNAMLTGGSTASFPVIWSRPIVGTGARAGTSGPVTLYAVSQVPTLLRSRRD
jgi:hypothetical protein